MTYYIALWPGKKLQAEEEQWLRSRIASLGADGSEGSLKEAKSLSHYLPENDHLWSPDALEGGAHVGPWTDMEGEIE